MLLISIWWVVLFALLPPPPGITNIDVNFAITLKTARRSAILCREFADQQVLALF
jgi:predicted secreted protein